MEITALSGAVVFLFGLILKLHKDQLKECREGRADCEAARKAQQDQIDALIECDYETARARRSTDMHEAIKQKKRLRARGFFNFFSCLLVLVFLPSCATKSHTTSHEIKKTSGTLNGHPVELFSEKKSVAEEERKTTVDTAEIARAAADAAAKAAKAAIDAAVPGLGTALAAAVPKSEPAPAGGLGTGEMAGLGGLALGAGAAWLRDRDRRRYARQAEDADRALKETVDGVEAAKGVLANDQWLRLRNALMTRQSTDTQKRIDQLTP